MMIIWQQQFFMIAGFDNNSNDKYKKHKMYGGCFGIQN